MDEIAGKTVLIATNLRITHGLTLVEHSSYGKRRVSGKRVLNGVTKIACEQANVFSAVYRDATLS